MQRHPRPCLCQPNKLLTPFMFFVFLIFVIFHFPRWVLLYMVGMVGVWSIGIQFQAHRFTQSHLKVVRQWCTHLPVAPFDVEIKASFGIVINWTIRIIAIFVFGPISMSRGMCRRPARLMMMFRLCFRISWIVFFFILYFDFTTGAAAS